MLEKIMMSVVMFLLVSTVGFLIYFLLIFNPFALDENKILKETQLAYRKTQYEKALYLKKEAIKNLSNFLIHHIDEVKSYNDFRGECFNISNYNNCYVDEFIPTNLIDSFTYFTDGLLYEIIDEIEVCDISSKHNIDPTKPSIAYNLVLKSEVSLRRHCSAKHEITSNRKFEEHKLIYSIYDRGLSKDTVLMDGYQYSIIVTPYSGF